jgi:hypothetical protein
LQATKKIADAKLAKDFQAVLKEFQKAQRLAAEREAAYAPFISQAGLPQRYFAVIYIFYSICFFVAFLRGFSFSKEENEFVYVFWFYSFLSSW